MAPILDNERLLKINAVARETGQKVGFRVQYPCGTIAGFFGMVTRPGYEAMGRGTAESLITAEAARLGISNEEFILLPIVAMFVK